MTSLTEDGESVCGPLCQHPSCWEAEKRRSRGLPRLHRTRTPPSLTTDDDLPQQSVVNLLGEYGTDPNDRFVMKEGYLPSQIARTITRESYPKVRAPNASPVSRLRSGTSASLDASPKKPPTFSKVEVQEVFELEDLHSSWQKTFRATQCYVWVPQDGKNRRPRSRHKYSDRLPTKAAECPKTLPPKDVTETMVPPEIEWKRELSTLFTEVWPLYKKKQQQQRSNDVQSPVYKPAVGRRIRMENEGLYELLDLPRDVLMKVLEYMDQRDLSDRRKLAETLLQILPLLEKENTAISLANSDVLLQNKMRILDSRQRPERLQEPFQPKQIFQLDQDTFDRLSTTNGPQSYDDPPDPDKMTDLTSLESYEQSLPNALKRLNKKKPLPDIPGKLENNKARIPSISLGLPEIPSGVKLTKPFSYGKQPLDFTLGRIPTPPTLPSYMQDKQKTDSIMSDEKASTIHVTVPSAPSEQDDVITPTPVTERPVSMKVPEPALHTVSPSFSNNVPKTPTTTPRLTNGKSNQSETKESASQREHSSALLVTIPETEPMPVDSQQAYSRGNSRNVHFSGVPPQPPSSPTDSYADNRENSMLSHTLMRDVTPSSGSIGDELKVVGHHKEFSIAKKGSLEEAHLSDKTKMGIGSVENTGTQITDSMAGNVDGKSEKSAMTLNLNSELGHESPAPTESTKPLWGEQSSLPINSPAPPPPSPEPTTALSMKRGSLDSRGTNQIAILQEIAESESEVTLSAMPPSNIDDISRINTPASVMLSPANPAQSVLRQQTIEDFLTEAERRGSVTQAVMPQGQSEDAAKINNVSKDQTEDEKIITDEDIGETLQAGIDNLDTFDTTEADYRAELQEEYSKLSNSDMNTE